jgi:hypothetical protein
VVVPLVRLAALDPFFSVRSKDFQHLRHAVVGPAARVEQALSLLDAEVVDAAVLDVNLNGQKSYPVTLSPCRRRLLSDVCLCLFDRRSPGQSDGRL